MKFGLRHYALAAAACVCVGAGAAAQGCIIVPPPDLAPAQVRPPRILHDSVSPPADVPLANWPDVFIVPIEMEDPDPMARPDYAVYLDPGETLNPSPLSNLPPPPYPTDGGLVLLSFTINDQALNVDLGVCHTIRTQVWDPQVPVLVRAGDSVTWVYGGSGPPFGCPVHDAGAFQDGGFPPPDDASADILAIPPEGGATSQ